MSCIEALVHPWMASFTALNRPTKSLRKEKMRRFLAKCKWKVTRGETKNTAYITTEQRL